MISMDLCFMQLLCPLPVVDTPTSCPLGTSPPVEVMLQVGFVRPHLQGLGGVSRQFVFMSHCYAIRQLSATNDRIPWQPDGSCLSLFLSLTPHQQLLRACRIRTWSRNTGTCQNYQKSIGLTGSGITLVWGAPARFMPCLQKTRSSVSIWIQGN